MLSMRVFDRFDDYMGRNIKRLPNFKQRIQGWTAQATLQFTIVCAVQSG